MEEDTEKEKYYFVYPDDLKKINDSQLRIIGAMEGMLKQGNEMLENLEKRSQNEESSIKNTETILLEEEKPNADNCSLLESFLNALNAFFKAVQEFFESICVLFANMCKKTDEDKESQSPKGYGFF